MRLSGNNLSLVGIPRVLLYDYILLFGILAVCAPVARLHSSLVCYRAGTQDPLLYTPFQPCRSRNRLCWYSHRKAPSPYQPTFFIAGTLHTLPR
jgi:hypothetical protein